MTGTTHTWIWGVLRLHEPGCNDGNLVLWIVRLQHGSLFGSTKVPAASSESHSL